jgi:hypothetical protein
MDKVKCGTFDSWHDGALRAAAKEPLSSSPRLLQELNDENFQHAGQNDADIGDLGAGDRRDGLYQYVEYFIHAFILPLPSHHALRKLR